MRFAVERFPSGRTLVVCNACGDACDAPPMFGTIPGRVLAATWQAQHVTTCAGKRRPV